MSRKAKSPITAPEVEADTGVETPLERATCDIDGPITAGHQAVGEELAPAPVAAGLPSVRHDPAPVAATVIPEVLPNPDSAKTIEQAKQAYYASLQAAGYPKQICPGVVEKAPGRFTASYGYPEAREWAKQRSIR